MAMRRPKKMARPTGASSSASRLGPGMETVELRFLPEGGWERGLQGDAGRDVKAPTPWVISWEVGAGASVDRGLRLARLKCTGTGADKGAGAAAEQFIIAPREGILTELVVPTGGHVFLAQTPPSQDSTPADTQTKSAANSQPPSARGDGTAESPATDIATATAGTVAGGAGAGAGGGGVVVVTGGGTTESVVVGRLSFCSHPELHGTLCTSCGRSVVPPAGKEEGSGGSGGGGRGKGGTGVDGGAGGGAGGKPGWDSAEGLEEGEGAMMSKVTMKGGGTLTVSSTAARRMHMDKSGRLLNSKKLSLVLDLDNTLLHCSDHPDAGRVSAPGVDGIHSLRLPNQPRDYYIKLRPGLRQFLAQAATMFEMTIYTAGTSQYADAVAGVLDPDRSLFQGRHFSTCYTPDLGRNTKSLERIFPCGLDMALIVDDRDDVWRGEQAKNLLLVRPYKFFVGQRSVPSGATHDTGGPQPPPNQPKAPLRQGAESPSPRGGGVVGGLDGDTRHHDDHGDKGRGGDKDAEVEADSTDRMQTESASRSTELGSQSTESESRSTESESPSIESNLRLTESKLRLTESESRLTESESLTTESGSPLTESESLFTESGSPLTESGSRLAESEGSDGSAHPNDKESDKDTDTKVKVVEDFSLSHVGDEGKGKGEHGETSKPRVEGGGGVAARLAAAQRSHVKRNVCWAWRRGRRG